MAWLTTQPTPFGYLTYLDPSYQQCGYPLKEISMTWLVFHRFLYSFTKQMVQSLGTKLVSLILHSLLFTGVFGRGFLIIFEAKIFISNCIIVPCLLASSQMLCHNFLLTPSRAYITELNKKWGFQRLRLALSMGHNKVSVFFPPPEDGTTQTLKRCVF